MAKERKVVSIDVYCDPEDEPSYSVMHARALRDLKRKYSFYDADDYDSPDKDGEVWTFYFIIYGQHWIADD